MLSLFKCIIVLLLEINIYLWFGCAMDKLKFLPKAQTCILRGIHGFLGYHVMFWCIGFPSALFNCSLNFLTLIWFVFIIVILFFIGIVCYSDLMNMYLNAIRTAWNYRFFLFPCIIFVAIVTYYVCINGQNDIDARTYIGEITSMLDTGKLVGIDVTTGNEMHIIPLRRAFAIFGENSAVICKIFQIHPLVFCRTTRAAINIFFFVAATFSLFRYIFQNYKKSVEHALMCTMLAIGMLFLFSNTIYTESRFMLYRAYEGKAYCSSTLVITTILIALKICSTSDWRFFLLLFLDMLAGMSISASATFILPLAGGSIIIAYTMVKRKWLYIPAILLSCLPNIVYIILSFSGISGFRVGG